MLKTQAAGVRVILDLYFIISKELKTYELSKHEMYFIHRYIEISRYRLISSSESVTMVMLSNQKKWIGRALMHQTFWLNFALVHISTFSDVLHVPSHLIFGICTTSIIQSAYVNHSLINILMWEEVYIDFLNELYI